MENFLLTGEELISQTPNNVVMLTTHRIRYNNASSYESRLVSIMLEKVSSCEVTYQSSPALLLIGSLIMLMGGLALTQNGDIQAGGILGLAFGFVLVLLYLSTRRHIIKIASDGGTHIGFETKGLKREAVVSFINSVEKAKNERMIYLYQQSTLV